MSQSFGTTIKTTLFGQSHAQAIGCVLEGLPAGFTVDLERLNRFMERRASRNVPGTTPRKEADVPEFLCGLTSDNITTGAPITAVLYNRNQKSEDYKQLQFVPRPSHADLGAYVKWQGQADMRGGGMFSGRMTAPLCVAGGIALQLLESKGIKIAAHILRLQDVQDKRFAALNHSDEALLNEQMRGVVAHELPVINNDVAPLMLEKVQAAQARKDSLGAVMECVCTGLPQGVGDPRFEGIDGTLAHGLLSLPSVKSICFGDMDTFELTGSSVNDAYGVFDGKVLPITNHAGGVVGGMTTGAPLWFSCIVKPTPSIGLPQQSVNLQTLEPVTLEVKGRHDACHALRIAPVLEAMCALVIADALARENLL